MGVIMVYKPTYNWGGPILQEYVTLFRRFEQSPLHYSAVKALTSQAPNGGVSVANPVEIGALL